MIVFCLLCASPVWATTYYADNTLVSNCTSGNYSIANRNCTGSDGNAYNTEAAAIAPLAAGDTLYIRAGTWTKQWNFQTPNKSGASGAYITMAGYPGERPVIQYEYVATTGTPYGPIRHWGTRGYFIFRNFVVNGIDSASTTSWYIPDGNHHITLEDIELKNINSSGLFVKATSDILIRNVTVHDLQPHPTSRRYGIYVSSGTNITLENNHIYNCPGGGLTVYANTTVVQNLVIRNNVIHHNNFGLNSPQAGIDIYKEAGANFIGISVYDNVIYENGLSSLNANPSGIRVASEVDAVKVWNNTVYGNKGYGILVGAGSPGGPATNTEIKNNILTGNTINAISNIGTGTTYSNNACLSGEFCGSTGKVTLSSATVCFVDQATDDYRLKQGTNTCRDAGTSVSSRPNPIGVTDVGAYEQGMITSATVVGTNIDVTTSVTVAPFIPASGITGFSVTCVGCTGSPVVSAAILKSEATGVLQLSISGISASGSCTISLGATNGADSKIVGDLLTGTSQTLNSASSLAVSGTCVNTSGIGGGGGGTLWSRLLLEEGSGTVANDNSGLAHHGTVSSGVTWVTGADGGVTIPTDATFRHIDIGYGSGINPTTQSFTTCAYVAIDLASVPTVVGSSTNGSNQRAYYGVYSVGGQPQWGLGVQSSTFFSGSEFVAVENPTLVCYLSNALDDTVTLRVNNVNGTISGKSVKTFTSYTLANNLRVGNDGVNTTNNGGFTVYGVWTWDSLASDADLTALYESLNPPGTALPCHSQESYIGELLYETGGSPVTIGTANQPIDVVDGGAVALHIQIDCTATSGSPLVFRFFASSDGATYQEIPETMGALGVSMLGTDTLPLLNIGATTGRLTGALTPTPGVTLATTHVSPNVTLTTGSSYTIRLLLSFAPGLAGQARYIIARQDNGLLLANGYPNGPAVIRIVNPMISTGF